VGATVHEVLKPLWLRILLCIDQLGCVLFLNGCEDETISSRAGKAMLQGKTWGCILCRALDFLQKDHCINSIEWDEGDTQKEPE
jgi:hypothetical protein